MVSMSSRQISRRRSKRSGAKMKSFGMPAGGDGNADPAVGKIIHDRPFLRDAHRVVQRQHDAAAAQS